jgi:citrate synthase
MPEDHPDAGHPAKERRKQARTASSDQWATAITEIHPNRILIRGYAVDELMGRLSFAESIYLLLCGELPTPSIGRLFGAVLVSSLDHGATPPSTIAARNVATTGASLRDCVCAGVVGFGQYHGGDIETCMRFLAEGLTNVRAGASYPEAARNLVNHCLSLNHPPSGFGHRVHSRDPRATRLLELAHDLELDGEHVRLIREIERVLEARPDREARPLPLNIDGAIAAVCGDLGFDPELGNALFIIARTPGLIAHAHEERQRQRPMREVNSKDSVYDGPPERRLPEPRT